MNVRPLNSDLDSQSLKAAGDIGYRWDMTSDTLELAGELLDVFGTPDRRLLVSGMALMDKAHRDDLAQWVPTRLDRTARYEREFRLRLADGTIIWVQDRGRAELNGQGQATRLVGVLRRVTAQKEREAHLRDISERDVLTGRMNRRSMLDRVEAAFTARPPGDESAAYLVLGIDHMAAVNDALGPTLGDIVLRGVADRLEAMLPEKAQLARVGGDTFGVILTETDVAAITDLAEKMLYGLREEPIETPLCPVHISVSAGAVMFPDGLTAAPEVLIRAEQALRDAQKRGRNTFTLFHSAEGRRESQRRSLEIGHMVQRALKHEGIKLAFQPIVGATSEQPLCYEVLARLIGPDGQPVPAYQFIPIVEQLGLSTHLDRKVLELAMQELEAEPSLHLAINVSGMSVGHAAFQHMLAARLQPRPDLAQRMIFEITESAAIQDVPATARFVDIVRGVGGQVALDDFGAGFTSIRHLRELKVTMLKIDRGIISDVGNNREQQVLANMVIGLARGLGLKTVAEGIENIEAATWLRQHQADMLQGYYFGKPTLDRPWAAGNLPATKSESAAAETPRLTARVF